MEARRNYADLLVRQEKYHQAIQEYRAALELDRQSWRIRKDLANLLATCPDQTIRDPDQAVQWALQAAELTQHQHAAEVLSVLAVAYAETGQFDLALKVLDRALALATAARQEALVYKLRRHRAMFEVGVRPSDNPDGPGQ